MCIRQEIPYEGYIYQFPFDEEQEQEDRIPNLFEQRVNPMAGNNDHYDFDQDQNHEHQNENNQRNSRSNQRKC